jgi:ABC-type branched-subunit amino acid transport system substrate-binding protein/outer membrane protein assembly factor BamD (BamD/ComL family)
MRLFSSDFCVRLLSLLLLCSLGLLLLWGCAVFTPTRPATTTLPSSGSPDLLRATPEERQAFVAADALRMRGNDVLAFQAFRDFVRAYPASVLTDQALLALGGLAAKLGEPQQAEGYYRRLIEFFPASTHLAEAYLERGVMLYHLQDIDASQAALQQALSQTVSRQQEAKAHYYLGTIARQRHQYAEALDELRIVVDTSPDTALIRQARSDIAAIIQNSMTVDELKQLSQQYHAEGYPGELILSRLAQVYREEGNVMEEMAVLQRFLSTFPDHPQAVTAGVRLRELQAMLTTDATKIGVLLPLSGEARVAGERALWGIELALATLRERYPTLTLSLLIRDSRGSSAHAGNVLRELVSEGHVIGVIGPLLSQVAIDLAPLAEQLGVPIISPYARDSRFPSLSSYAFRNSITDVMQARFLAEYATHVLHLSRFAVLYPDEPYGRTLKDLFIEHVIQLQGEVVTAAPYPPEATDFRQPIKSIGGVDDETLRDLLAGTATLPLSDGGTTAEAEGSPKPYEAIFLPGYYDTVGLVAPELAFYNITGVQLLGGDGWNSPKIVEIGERFVEGGIFVDGFFVDASSPSVAAFVEAFQSRYGESPDLLAAQAYDTLEMVAQVLQSGVRTRPQLRDGLLQVRDFPGVSGTTSINAQGDAEKILYLLTVRHGHIVQLN